MNYIKEVSFEDLVVQVPELSVRDIRNWLKGQESRVKTDDPLGSWLFADLTFDDIVDMTTLKRDELDDLRPSQVAEIVAAIKEVNSVFFERLAQLRPASQA